MNRTLLLIFIPLSIGSMTMPSALTLKISLIDSICTVRFRVARRRESPHPTMVHPNIRRPWFANSLNIHCGAGKTAPARRNVYARSSILDRPLLERAAVQGRRRAGAKRAPSVPSARGPRRFSLTAATKPATALLCPRADSGGSEVWLRICAPLCGEKNMKFVFEMMVVVNLWNFVWVC